MLPSNGRGRPALGTPSKSIATDIVNSTPDPDAMSRTSPLRLTGIDGKEYPRRPLPTSERDLLIGHCHWLKHDLGLSVRGVRDHLLYNYNLRRSVGSISAYLSDPCVQCSGVAHESPEHLLAGDDR